MQQDTGTAAVITGPEDAVPPGYDQRAISDAEYDFAFAVIGRVKRAATDTLFRVALYETYALNGLAELIPGLVRAIDEYRVNHAGELVAA